MLIKLTPCLGITSGANAIKKFTPSLGIPYLGVYELGVKFGNHLSLLSLGF
jgi:hypothetical protein